MNGVPEAIGTGVNELVKTDPVTGIFVACLFIVVAILWKWGLDGWKAKREADKYHSDYVEKQLTDERKNTELLDRILDNQSRPTTRGGR